MFKDQLKKWATPLSLLLVSSLAYGLFAFQHGFYWDDWGFNWARAHLGVSGIMKQIAYNRVIRSYWEGLLTPLLGVHPAAWQVYFVFLRWGTALAFWGLLNTLWVDKKWQNSLAAFAFLVYPGLTQAPIAITYQYFWNLLIVFFISLVLMIQAVRSTHLRVVKLALSVGLSTLCLFGLEYLFGLELARIVFIWTATKDDRSTLKERFKKTVLFYLPYALFLAAYLYWRVFLYASAIYTVNETSISIAGMLKLLLDALPVVSIGAWTKVLVQPFSAGSGLSPRLGVVMGTIILAGTLLLARLFQLISTRAADAEDTSLRGSFSSATIPQKVGETAASQVHAPRSDVTFRVWVSNLDWDWLLLGVTLMLPAGAPFYVANFPVQLDFPQDRFTFPFIAGVSMLLVWLLGLIKNQMQRFTLAALLISLAITTQIYNSDVYRREFRLQQLFAQQLFWRAPDIAPGTLFLAEDNDVFPHNDDEAFAMLVNWAYNPNQTEPLLDYDYFYVSGRYGADFHTFEKGEPIFKKHLLPTFTGNTDQVLVLHFNPPSCMRILDPVYDADVLVAPRDVDTVNTGTLTLPRALAPALPLSDPRAIIAKSNDDFAPPEWLFGAEPAHTWCYYFEKADLARQTGDWGKVAKLGDKAFGLPLSPADAAEYLPFIEAYARLGRYDDAVALTESAVEKNPVIKDMLCALWQRLGSEGISAEINACPSLTSSLTLEFSHPRLTELANGKPLVINEISHSMIDDKTIVVTIVEIDTDEPPLDTKLLIFSKDENDTVELLYESEPYTFISLNRNVSADPMWMLQYEFPFLSTNSPSRNSFMRYGTTRAFPFWVSYGGNCYDCINMRLIGITENGEITEITPKSDFVIKNIIDINQRGNFKVIATRYYEWGYGAESHAGSPFAFRLYDWNGTEYVDVSEDETEFYDEITDSLIQRLEQTYGGELKAYIVMPILSEIFFNYEMSGRAELGWQKIQELGDLSHWDIENTPSEELQTYDEVFTQLEERTK